MIHFIVQVLTLIHIRLVLSLPMSKVLESEDESDPQNPLLVAVSSEARQPVRRFHCTNEAVGPPSVQHSSAHRIRRHRQLPFPSNKPVSLSLATHAGSTSHPLFQDPEPTPDRARDRRRAVRLAWEKLLRWSRSWRSKAKTDVLVRTKQGLQNGFKFGFFFSLLSHVAYFWPWISLKRSKPSTGSK